MSFRGLLVRVCSVMMLLGGAGATFAQPHVPAQAPLVVATTPARSTDTTSQPADDAGATPDEVKAPLRQDVDEPIVAALRIGDWFTAGGTLSSEFRGFAKPTALGEPELRSDEKLGSSLQIRTLIMPVKGIEFFSRLELAGDYRFMGPVAPADTGLRHTIREAYLEVETIGGLPIGIQVGRQRFRDSQEFFFDDTLDAARVRAQFGRWRFEAAIAESLDGTPYEERADEQKRHYIGQIQRRVTRQVRATGFVIARADRSSRRDEPVWFGVTLASRGAHDVMFWSNAAARRGHSNGTTLRGWAADGAVTWHTRTAWRASLTAGYSWASGDDDSVDTTDGAFRQPAMADNAGRLGGIRRVRLFGEAFDPELSNMRILTLAISLRPAQGWSTDVIVHRYAQDVARRRLADNAFEVRANGDSTDLGRALDVQLVRRIGRRVDLFLASGLFLPGRAFDAVARPNRVVFTFRPQVRVYF
ncbi:MAG: alginate export family protein [Vicinamibacterales bacterium]